MASPPDLPTTSREEFWQHFLNIEITVVDQLIIRGDLNFSLGFGESWGSQAQVDPMSEFFRDTLDLHNLTDVPMIKPLPTWRN